MAGDEMRNPKTEFVDAVLQMLLDGQNQDNVVADGEPHKRTGLKDAMIQCAAMNVRVAGAETGPC
jgi:hypothetical protein